MDLEFDEVASGPCIVCGEETQGSMYWLRMTEAQWEVIHPYVEEMTSVSHSGVKLVMDILFWPQLCKPFCGTKCVQAYYRKVASDNCKKGS